METVGTICEGEWNSSFNGMCSDEADFMAQLLGNCSLPSGGVWAANESSYKDVETNASTSMFSFSLGNSIISPSSTQGSFLPFLNSNVMEEEEEEGDDFLNQDASNDRVDSDNKLHVDVVRESFKEDKFSETSKKRPQIPSGSQRSKRFKKCDENDESNNTTSTNHVVFQRQSSSGCCSEDDDSVNGVKSSSSSKNVKGKARASRGSATDPQSLYARKRRERINERLRILQTLVPNGTKVDISTMLEEAVQYVKFLQLQIKLLSSDDLWMYSPIAYNGMDLGLDIKFPSPPPQS